MSFLKEPKRTEDGKIDIKWWESLPHHEKSLYNVWATDLGLEESKKKPTEVVIKKNQLDIDKIINYSSPFQKKFEFRPTRWEHFIGQERAKKQAQTIKKIWNKGLKAHFLVDGIKGHGKTTYVELLAKDMNAHLIERMGKQVNEENLVDIINEINTSTNDIVILFIDELDSMDTKVIKILNSIIESFKTGGKNIKPFIFAGATINKHILVENNPDTLDRIPTHIKFVRYNSEQIMKILKQYKDQLFKKDNVSNDVLLKLASNCKYNPRTGIGMLSNYVVEENLDEIFLMMGIVKDGLNLTDVKILEALSQSEKPMGANSLALRCGLTEKQYVIEVEPYLLEFGYINRVPSRIISEKGKEFLSSLKRKKK